jgi:murein L,D-transpeptidase YafK
MSGFESMSRRAITRTGRALLFGCLLGAALLPATVPVAARATPVAVRGAEQSDPEALLIEIYKELGADHLRNALAKADRLVATYPNFHLGHLVRGDLLLMQTRPVTTFGNVKGPEDKLRNLREEAMVRLQALRFRPSPDMVPRAVLQLRDDQKHVLVVDAKHSRLYVYESRGDRLKLVTDYYISQGKLGVNKLKAGDQKTPVGVYYITGHLPGARLPDFYGTGALPINYPNEWDKLNGRSGSGIWLHGTPSDSYSRPPLSSDGCVVLTNPDLHKLFGSVEIGKTPVVISESAEFVSQAKWSSERQMALSLVERWRRDVESLDPQRTIANYSTRFKSERGEDLATWFVRYRQFMGGAGKLSLRLRETSYFFYPGREDMIVATFTQDAQSGKSRSSVRKRQYWVKEGAQWKILYELTI